MSEQDFESKAPEDAEKFDFDTEPGSVEPPPGFTLKKASEKKGRAAKQLLILLLIVVGAGAVFYLFGQDLFAPEPPMMQAKAQAPTKMKVPDRPKPVEKAEAVKEEVVPQEKVAAVAAKPAPIVAPTPAPVSAFALTAGSYLYKGELNRTLKQVEKLGYKQTSSSKPEPHEVTRLLVGLYSKPLAEKRLAEVKKMSDGAFWVAEEGKYAVYAGSFMSIDKARRLADLLYQQGVRVDERQIMVNLPRTTVRFGGFATRAEAEKVVRKLEKLGVDKLQIVPFK